MIRLYQFRLEWDPYDPMEETTTIIQVNQKCMFGTNTTGTLRFRRGENLKIVGAQVLLAQTWFDTPNMESHLQFKSDFTWSTYKKVQKGGQQIGIMVDMYLTEAAQKLSH